MTGRRALLCCAAALLVLPTRLLAQGQARGKGYLIGYLTPRAGPGAVDEFFVRGLHELGYAIGRDVRIEYRWAGNDSARLRPLAEELVRLNVDVILTATTAATRAAMHATRTIPIVMAATADPVAMGLVASLGRPGGNVTGMSLQTVDVARKRLQQMREIVPGMTRIGLLAEHVSDPAQGATSLLVAETRAAAREIGVSLLAREIANASNLTEAFAHYRQEKAQALIVQVGPLMIELRAQIIELAARERLPAMYEVRNFADDGGGLVSYGPDLRESYRRAAGYVDRILKGAKAADLPVQQPDRLALIVNLKAAKALGLTIPRSVLLRADELIY